MGKNRSTKLKIRYVAKNPISIGVFCPIPNLSRINLTGTIRGSVTATESI